MDQTFASENFILSSLKSEIEFLDRQFQFCAQQLRDRNVEIEEIEALEKEREFRYVAKRDEMKEFESEIQRYAEEIGGGVEELRCGRDKLSALGDIHAAKLRKSELLALKQNVPCSLESNKQLRATLEEQLQSLW